MARIKIPTGRNGQFLAVIETDQIESISDLGKKISAVRMKSGVTHTGPTKFEDLAKITGFDKADSIEDLSKRSAKK